MCRINKMYRFCSRPANMHLKNRQCTKSRLRVETDRQKMLKDDASKFCGKNFILTFLRKPFRSVELQSLSVFSRFPPGKLLREQMRESFPIPQFRPLGTHSRPCDGLALQFTWGRKSRILILICSLCANYSLAIPDSASSFFRNLFPVPSFFAFSHNPPCA